jgi:alpha-mannosidase
VDDYLDVRPDMRERLRALVAAGRLTIGPWYVLADELLAGDEPLVRNLLEGRRRGADLGGWLAVGYSPDAFGHPATLPTILAGFGIADAVLWRGHGEATPESRDLFRWRGPDGVEALVHHLPPAGYEYGAELPTAAGAARERWTALRAVLEPRAATSVLLILNGADHHAMQPDLRAAVGALRRASGLDVRVGTLSDYFTAARAAMAGGAWRRLKRVAGELRSSGGHAWALQGVAATRTALKQRIAEGAALLVRWAEPQAALAMAAGAPDRRPLLAAAWRTHLANLSHDVLGGCVTDEVAEDVATRARHVVTEARGLLADALGDRLRQDAVRRRRDPAARKPALVLVNPSARRLGGVVEATVTLFAAREVVGRPAPSTPPAPLPSFTLLDAGGRNVPYQILTVTQAHERLDSPRDYPEQDRVWAVRVALAAPLVSPLGLTMLDVIERAPRHRTVRDGVEARDGLRTGWGAVRVTPSGFVLNVRRRALRLAPLLTSEVDGGDTYTIQPVAGDRPLAARWGRATVVWPGPLVAAIARPFRIGGRVRGMAFLRVERGSSLLRLVIEGENRAAGHRLRLRVPVAARGRATADMAFGPDERQLVRFKASDYLLEWLATTAPMHRYVSGGGWTLLTRGLHEYELLRDGSLAVTLLRSVGELSRGDLAARPGHAGWPVATPAAEGRGAFRVELALAPVSATVGSGPDAWDAVEEVAEEFHAPLAGLMYRSGVEVPRAVAGPQLEGAGLAFRALKPRDDGPGVVLRCVNLTRRPQRGRWVWPVPVGRAYRARLDETVIAEIATRANRRVIPFEAGPREVVTVVVET